MNNIEQVMMNVDVLLCNLFSIPYPLSKGFFEEVVVNGNKPLLVFWNFISYPKIFYRRSVQCSSVDVASSKTRVAANGHGHERFGRWEKS